MNMQDLILAAKFLETEGADSDLLKAVRDAIRIIEDQEYILDHIRFQANTIFDLTKRPK